MGAESISFFALIVSGFSLLISLANRGEDLKVRVAEKHSELIVLIGQLNITVMQHQIVLFEAAQRAEKSSKHLSLRFKSMNGKLDGMIENIKKIRKHADVVQNIKPPSNAIIEIERIKSELTVQQANVIHMLQETKEISSHI